MLNPPLPLTGEAIALIVLKVIVFTAPIVIGGVFLECYLRGTPRQKISRRTPMTTIKEKFDYASGRPSGFDYMRLSLALSVVLWHTVEISYGRVAEDYAWNSPWRMLLGLILPMFFSLSAFLVAGSLE